MKKTCSLILVFLCLSATTFAQGWQWVVGSTIPPVGYSYLEGKQTTIDNNGNVFICGENEHLTSCTFGSITISNPTSRDQALLIKADSNGVYKWVKAITAPMMTTPVGIVTNMSGCSYIFGLYIGNNCDFSGTVLTNPSISFTSPAYFLAKYDPNGNLLWARNIALLNNTGSYIGLPHGGIGIDELGCVYMSGEFSTATDTIGTHVVINADASGATSDVFLAKYDSLGNDLWAKSFGASNNELVYSCVASPAGNIVISGTYKSAAITHGSSTITNADTSVPNLFIAKYDAAGNPLWADSATGSPAKDYQGMLAMDNAGSIYMNGSFKQSSINFGAYTLTNTGAESAFLVKYDSSGSVKWARSGGGSGIARAYSASADKCGRIWVAGAMDNGGLPMSFSGHVLTPPYLSSEPAFLAQYDSSGNFLNALAIKNGGDDLLSIVVDNNGTFYIGGDIFGLPANDTLILGGDTITVASLTEAIFLARYRYDNPNCAHFITLQTIASSATDSHVDLYPNPANDMVTIHCSASMVNGGKMEIYDLTGRLLQTHLLDKSNTDLPVGNLSAGLYHCRIYADNVLISTNKLVIIK